MKKILFLCLLASSVYANRIHQNPLTGDLDIIDSYGGREETIKQNPLTGDYDVYDNQGGNIGHIHKNPLTGDLEY